MALQPRLLILDEATSALTAADVERVFQLLHELRRDGLALLYISHRMHEIAALADTCSVFRNGRHVETFPQGTPHRPGDRPPDDRPRHRAGLPAEAGRGRSRAAVASRSPAWVGASRLADLSFTVGKGEIVGLGGLDGQGQRELMLALFGVLRGVEGTRAGRRPALFDLEPGPRQGAGLRHGARARGSQDRGAAAADGVRDNLSLAALGQLGRLGVVDRGAEDRAVDEMIRRLHIKLGEPTDPVGTLSGGNQQKVVIGKWLLTRPRLILLNDPTRGIDVGTKQELYALMRELADAGAAILFYSTDYDELVGCCNRVLILYDGRIVRVLEGDEITEHAIVASALNITAPAVEAVA